MTQHCCCPLGLLPVRGLLPAHGLLPVPICHVARARRQPSYSWLLESWLAPSRRPAGFGFVVMSTEEEAERCVRHLNDRDVSTPGSAFEGLQSVTRGQAKATPLPAGRHRDEWVPVGRGRRCAPPEGATAHGQLVATVPAGGVAHHAPGGCHVRTSESAQEDSNGLPELEPELPAAGLVRVAAHLTARSGHLLGAAHLPACLACPHELHAVEWAAAASGDCTEHAVKLERWAWRQCACGRRPTWAVVGAPTRRSAAGPYGMHPSKLLHVYS